MNEGVGDLRPARRIVDPSAGVQKVRRERRCRCCGMRVLGQLNRMHLVPKGQRGDDVDANIVPGCGSGTAGCHGALTDHHNASYPSLLAGKPWTVVAAALRASLHPEEKGYILIKKGPDWLDRVYPQEEEA